MNPIKLNFNSPTDVRVTPVLINKTISICNSEGFSRPAKKLNVKTQTGVNAFNIWIYDTERKIQALFPALKLAAKNIAMGIIF